ncbi:putative carbohydrate-binding X8 domain-containing protein, plant [Helianthus annuus]|nr:putative carbohydrate-binding X8 domain-containing protein, plant [Helianthus annuus]
MSPEPSHLLRLLLFLSAALPLSSAAATLHQQQQQSGGVSLNLWCVAKNNAEDSALQSAIDWACGAGGADCSPIQQGGPCYDGSDIRKTASYAFNDYCTKNGMTEDTCNFANTAALTSLDPSKVFPQFMFMKFVIAVASFHQGMYLVMIAVIISKRSVSESD